MFEIAPTNMQIDFIKKLDDIKEFCKYAKIIEIQRKIDFNVIIEIGVIMFKDDFKKIYYGKN